MKIMTNTKNIANLIKKIIKFLKYIYFYIKITFEILNVIK